MATDPLSLVYNALWDTLEANAALTALVRIGNRVKWASWLHIAIKDVFSQSDLPQIAIVTLGDTYGLQNTSNSTFLTSQFEARLIVGDNRLGVTGGFLPIKWELIRAFAGWKTKLTALTWKSKKFVVDARSDALSDLEFQEKGASGWVTFMRFNVRMSFTTSDVRP